MTTKSTRKNVGSEPLTLPAEARLPINRCNLPAAILGGLSFQQHPVELRLDGVGDLHAQLFRSLRDCRNRAERATCFRDYMRAHFLLEHPEDAGYTPRSKSPKRIKADYLRIVRGWMFDADSREAAVLKAWVESRFGLRVRNHRGVLDDFEGPVYLEYLEARSRGLYNTNALEAQLDLLYSFCQFELACTPKIGPQLTLYRGVNALARHEHSGAATTTEHVLLLNNVNSFTSSRERADEFGDAVLECSVPTAKVIFFPGLIPSLLQGEDEYIVIGGLYRVRQLSTI